jgi:hypothetical protein
MPFFENIFRPQPLNADRLMQQIAAYFKIRLHIKEITYPGSPLAGTDWLRVIATGTLLRSHGTITLAGSVMMTMMGSVGVHPCNT